MLCVNRKAPQMFKEFIDIAKNEIKAIKEKNSNLQQEENRIRNRLNDIAKMRSKFVIDKDALATYVSACTSNRYLCPFCFISSRNSVEMKPISSKNTNDIFKCPHCFSIIEVENIS